MLAPALADPDPVLIFEHGSLYNVSGELVAPTAPVDLDHAAIRRPGTDISLITYGGSLPKALAAADELAAEGISAEVIDLRTLRPLDDAAIADSVARTHRAVVIDEAWRTGSLAAEVSARIAERFLLRTGRARRAGVQRRGAHAVRPAAGGSRPSADRRHRRGRPPGGGLAMAEFTMPSLGADMDEGTLLEWLVNPAPRSARATRSRSSRPRSPTIEVECFETGTMAQLLVEPGTTVPVGTPLALIGPTTARAEKSKKANKQHKTLQKAKKARKLEGPTEAEKVKEPPPRPTRHLPEKGEPTKTPLTPPEPAAVPVPSDGGRRGHLEAGPLVRHLAEQAGRRSGDTARFRTWRPRHPDRCGASRGHPSHRSAAACPGHPSRPAARRRTGRRPGHGDWDGQGRRPSVPLTCAGQPPVRQPQPSIRLPPRQGRSLHDLPLHGPLPQVRPQTGQPPCVRRSPA